MGRRLLDFDPASGEQVWHSYDHQTKTTEIQVVQDAAPFLRINRAELNRDTGTSGGLNGVSRQQIRQGWWHVARIPNAVQAAYAKARGIKDPMWIYKREHAHELKRLLNDPAWAHLRTNPGRV